MGGRPAGWATWTCASRRDRGTETEPSCAEVRTGRLGARGTSWTATSLTCGRVLGLLGGGHAQLRSRLGLDALAPDVGRLRAEQLTHPAADAAGAALLDLGGSRVGRRVVLDCQWDHLLPGSQRLVERFLRSDLFEGTNVEFTDVESEGFAILENLTAQTQPLLDVVQTRRRPDSASSPVK